MCIRHGKVQEEKAMGLHYAGDEVYDIYHMFTDKGKGTDAKQLINGAEVPAE